MCMNWIYDSSFLTTKAKVESKWYLLHKWRYHDTLGISHKISKITNGARYISMAIKITLKILQVLKKWFGCRLVKQAKRWSSKHKVKRQLSTSSWSTNSNVDHLHVNGKNCALPLRSKKRLQPPTCIVLKCMHTEKKPPRKTILAHGSAWQLIQTTMLSSVLTRRSHWSFWQGILLQIES